MGIRGGFRTALLLGGLLAVLAASVFFSIQGRLEQDSLDNERLETVAQETNQLIQLTYGILLYGGERMEGQWQSQFDALSVLAAHPVLQDAPSEREILNRITLRLEDMRRLLGGLVEARSAKSPDPITIGVISSQLFQETVLLQSAARTVKHMSEQALRDGFQRYRDRQLLASALFGVLAAMYGGLALWLFHRRILTPLEGLGRAIELNSRGKIARAEIRSEDEIGKVAKAFNALLDLRDEQQREVESLAERQRIIFESANTGIAITSPTKGWLSANDHLCRMLGYSQDELRRMTWAVLTHPDDLAKDEEQFGQLMAGVIDAYEMEKRFIRKDGSAVHTHLAIACHRVGSWVEYVIASITDIGPHKAQQEELRRLSGLLRNILDTTPDMVIVKDHNLRTVICNKVYAARLGKAPEQLVGHSDIENGWDVTLVKGDVAAGVAGFEADDRAALSGKVVHNAAAVVTFADRSATYDVYKVPLRDQDGGVVGLLSIARDVSDRVRAEDALRRANAELEERVAARTADLQREVEERRRAEERAQGANRAKSELLAAMSHELRTPLNAVIGYSEALLSGAFGEAASDRHLPYLRDIHGAGMHLLALINDILDLSAVEAGKMGLNEESFAPAEMIEVCMHVIRPRAMSGEVTVETHIPEGLPRLVADPRRFKQVALNLMSNAVKFTDPGGRVTVALSADRQDGFRLIVSDTGVGMTEKEIVVARTLFGQSGDSMVRKREGTGLGLPLTINLVEAHGGSLSIDSERGKGTTVTAWFPPDRLDFTPEPTRPQPLASPSISR
jgi:PAS domain S-box-containing protein